MSKSLFSFLACVTLLLGTVTAQADHRRGHQDRNEGKDIGTILGGVVGGVIAGAAGGNTTEVILGAGVGALGGRVIGDAIDDENDREDYYNRRYGRDYDRYDRYDPRDRRRPVRRARTYNQIDYDCFPYRFGPYPNQVGFVVVELRTGRAVQGMFYDQYSCVNYARQMNRYRY